MSELVLDRFFYEDAVEFSIETAVETIEDLLNGDYAISKRSIALLLLQEDHDVNEIVRQKEGSAFDEIREVIHEVKRNYGDPLDFVIAMRRKALVDGLVKRVVVNTREEGSTSLQERLSRLAMHPLTGIPILLMILYWGVYKIVGEFGAGTAVDFIEGTIFETHLNPWITRLLTSWIPWPIIADLFVGEYGVLTLGVRYAVALILPIVTTFFIVFSIIEDSGYLPRLAMLIDRVFKMIGLSGRAVIPIVLGFGCDTMATVVTRTLPTLRERVISTILLSLAIPCSAQLGVIMSLLQGRPAAFGVWAGVLVLVFLLIGFLTARLMPGERPVFYMELPPLRLPKVSNVVVKTYSRVAWYFREILPFFLLASVLIWFGQVTRLFDFLIHILKWPVSWIGLPPEAAQVFLFGFFRRDYGAAGLYDLNKTGLLSGVQIAVACVVLTLFLPCIAQFLVNIRERGIKTGLGISVFVLFFSFGVAVALNYILVSAGMSL